MKKFFLILTIGFVVLAVAGYVFRDLIGFFAMSVMMKPDHAFADRAVPTAPDYAQRTHWAALPDRDDLADVVPDGVIDIQRDAAVDVFFVHPTTYYNTATWNQPLGDLMANAITDGAVLRGQASVFNSSGAVYAPRYRQATLYSFMDGGESGAAALDLAYADVLAAFDYFIGHFNQGRPFILAGHSQGSRHLVPLLKDRIEGRALRSRMVAAYPIGFDMSPDQLPTDVPVCSEATQTGCLVTWNAVGPDAYAFTDTSRSTCVNPLSWRIDGARVDFGANLGAVSFGALRLFGEPDPGRLVASRPAVVERGVADAQCIGGRLIVTEIRSANFAAMPMGRDNYHLYDYSLFHMNLRKNAEARVAAYLATVGAPLGAN